MTDPCEAICDAQVEFANAISGLDISFEAKRTENPDGELRLEHSGLQVFFIPFAEQETKTGRGGEVLEVFETSMLVVRKITPEFTRSVLSGFVRAIRAEFRGKKMAGFRYMTSETVTKFDPEQLDKYGQFCSVVRLSYMGTA